MPGELRRTYDVWVHEAARAAHAELSSRLEAVILYGSVARGSPTPLSDIDLLLIVDPLPKGRRARAELAERIVAGWEGERAGLPSLSLVLRTQGEVEAGFPLLLDIIHEGIVVYDPHLRAAGLLREWRKRLETSGVRRVQHGETWHWDLGRARPSTSGEGWEL